MTDLKSDASHLRAAPRLKLFLPTEMSARGRSHRVHLLNVSMGGALVHCDDPPAHGALVRVKCGSNSLPARIAWVSGKRFGVAFAAPLSDAQLGSLFNEQARGSHIVEPRAAAA